MRRKGSCVKFIRTNWWSCWAGEEREMFVEGNEMTRKLDKDWKIWKTKKAHKLFLRIWQEEQTEEEEKRKKTYQADSRIIPDPAIWINPHQEIVLSNFLNREGMRSLYQKRYLKASTSSIGEVSKIDQLSSDRIDANHTRQDATSGWTHSCPSPELAQSHCDSILYLAIPDIISSFIL